MPRWVKFVAGWAVAAFIAVMLSWGAVAQVRDRVVQPTITIPATAAAAVPAPNTPTEAPIIHADPGTGDTTVSTTAPSTTAPPGATSTNTQTPTTNTNQAPGSTTTSQPPGSTTTTAAPPQAQITSYTLVGGVVTISSSPGVVTFVSAVPQPGFSTDRRETGPDRVRIRFESAAHNSEFRAEWQDGELKITKNESVEV